MPPKPIPPSRQDDPPTTYTVGDINGDGVPDSVTIPASAVRKIEKFAQDPTDEYLQLRARRFKVEISQQDGPAKTVTIRAPQLSYLQSKPAVMDYVARALEVKMATQDTDLKYYDKDGAVVVVGTMFTDSRTGLPMRVLTLIDGAVIATVVPDENGVMNEALFYARYGKKCATYDLTTFKVGQSNQAKEAILVTVQPG